MQFLELEISNLFSFEHAKLVLYNLGVTLFSGQNGAGKSSLTSKAICWTLFGETPGGLKGDAVVNANNPDGPARASLKLITAQGKVITIERTRNPSRLTVSGEGFRVPSQTQAYIEQLIGRNLDAFLTADYFGQDRSIDFIRATPRVQLQVLEGILRLDRLDVLSSKAKELADGVAKVIACLEAQQQQRLGGRSSFMLQKFALAERVRKVEDDLEHLRKQMSEPRRWSASQSELGGLRQRKSELQELIAETTKRMVDERVRQNSITAQLRALMARVRTIKPLSCPTCGQEVSAELTQTLQVEQDQLKEEIAALHAQMAPVTLSTNPLQAELASIDAAIMECVKVRDNEVELLERNISIGEGLLQELAEQGEGIDREIAAADQALTEVDAEIDAQTKRASVLRFWQDAFGRSFKNFIVKETLPFLEERTAHHLALLNNPNLEVRFSTIKTLKSGEDRSLFNVTTRLHRGGQSYDSLSGGEKQIASFAVGLALSELTDAQSGSASNLMVLDEPFTELDDRNCQNVVAYVTQELARRKEAVIVISNDERMKSLIPHRIDVEKGESGTSEMRWAHGQ